MGKHQNCWEFKRCGREIGGPKMSEMGACPAATCRAANGLNGGRNGGRICWAVAGTLCGGQVQGTFARKQLNCMKCEYFEMVKKEEGPLNFMLLIPGQTS